MYVSTVGMFSDQQVDRKKTSLDISEDNSYPESKNDSSKYVEFYCQLCHTKFSSKFNLNRHVRRSHPLDLKRSENTAQTSNRKFICDICHEMFLDKLSFNNHYLLHKIVQPVIGNNKANIQNQCIILYVNETKNSDSPKSSCQVPIKIELPVHIEHPVGTELPVNNEQSASTANCFNTDPSTNTENPVNNLELSEDDVSKYGSTVDENCGSINTKKRLECQFCPKSYSSKFSLNRHQRKEHKSSNLIFPDVATLLDQYSEHKGQPHEESNKNYDDEEVTSGNELEIYSEVLSIDNEGTTAEIPSGQSVCSKDLSTDKLSLKETINPEDNVSSSECFPSFHSTDPKTGIVDKNTNTKKKRQCQFCTKSFSTKFSLNRHHRKEHKSSNKIFPDEATLQDHNNEPKRPPPHEESNKNVNNEEVNSGNKLDIYSEVLSIDNEGTTVEIPSDQSVSSKDLSTNKHSLKETTNPEDNVSSSECFPSFQSTDPKTELLDKNTSKKKFKLKFKRFRCKKCQKTFSKKFNLHRHIKRKHIKSKRVISAKNNCFPVEESNCKFICDICNEMFFDKASLYDHYLVHTNTIRAHNMQIDAVCNDTHNIKDQCIIVCTNGNSLEEQSYPQQFLLTRYSMPTKLKTYACHICNESFEEKTDLKDHLAAHEAKRLEEVREKFICELCKEEFKDHECLKQHLLKHEIQKSFICCLCQETFETEKYLKKHQSRHTEEESEIQFWCKVCNKIFDQKQNLNKHLLTHSNSNTKRRQEESFVCPICNESLGDKSSLICHLAVHNAGKRDNLNAKIVCLFCKKRFTDRQLFQEHLFEHTNKNKNLSNICDEVIPSKECLEKHMDSNTDKNSKSKFSCEICDKSFNENLPLWHHLLTHSVKSFSSTTEKAHLCHICNESFNAEIDLKIHLEVHEVKRTNKILNGEMFTCEICNKDIIDIRHFKLHLLEHTNQKIFMCGVCDTSFLSQTAIKKHMAIHNNQQRYLCDICKKSFNLIFDLTQHELVHKNGKKFVCEFCSKQFQGRFKLKKHLQTCQASKKADVIKKNQNPLTSSEEDKKIVFTIPVQNSSPYSIYSRLHSFPSSLKY